MKEYRLDFVNQYGVLFSVTTVQLEEGSNDPAISPLEYIQYCLERGSKLLAVVDIPS